MLDWTSQVSNNSILHFEFNYLHGNSKNLTKRSITTSLKCRLAMIPIHLIEYERECSKKAPELRRPGENACHGKVLVAGCPPRVKFLLRSQEIRPIEKQAKRDAKLDSVTSDIRRRMKSTSILETVGAMSISRKWSQRSKRNIL